MHFMSSKPTGSHLQLDRCWTSLERENAIFLTVNLIGNYLLLWNCAELLRNIFFYSETNPSLKPIYNFQEITKTMLKVISIKVYKNVDSIKEDPACIDLSSCLHIPH